MTVLEMWHGPCSGTYHYTLNDCVSAAITGVEARCAGTDEFPLLVVRRVAPLVWLAMPGHEDSVPDEPDLVEHELRVTSTSGVREPEAL
jgi:hypothetical protein